MLLGRAARNMNYGFSGVAGESAGGAGSAAGVASGDGADAGGSEPVAAGGMLSDGGTAVGGTAVGVSGAGALKPDCGAAEPDWGAPGAGARGDTELSGSDEGKSPNPAEPAPMVLTADGLASMSLRFSGRYHRQANAQVKIHKRTATAVMRVKISPALTPNALWPPAPPKAPVNPPPRPLCSRIIPMMKKERMNSKEPKMYCERTPRGINT